MLLYCAICDDEKTFRFELRTLLEQYAREQQMEIRIREYESGSQLLASGLRERLIFLDIDMEGINGLAAGAAIWRKNRNIRIIYITNLGDLLSKKKAQNHSHAFAYLEKPINREELFSQLRDVCMQMQEAGRSRPSLSLQVIGRGKMKFPIEQICYFEATGGRIRAVVEKKGSYQEYYLQDTLTNMEEKLRERGFALSHKAFLVNVRYVQRIRNYIVYMLNGEKLPLSQKRSPAFRKQWYRFVEESGL